MSLTLLDPDIGEFTFELEGTPGNRWVVATRWDGVPYGRLFYRVVLAENFNGWFGPHGDPEGCEERDFLSLNCAQIDELRFWTEQEALGIAATGEEAYDD